MDMMSDFENLDVMLGNVNNNPIERELVDAIDQSLAHGDADTNVYQGNEYIDYLHENNLLRKDEVRQSFETFSNELNLRLSQEMDSMMSMMHSQINRAITAAIVERVIPEIQNIANSMSSMGHRETEASLSPNSKENRESASGPKIKIAKKDSRSVGDLRDTSGQVSHIENHPKPQISTGKGQQKRGSLLRNDERERRTTGKRTSEVVSLEFWISVVNSSLCDWVTFNSVNLSETVCKLNKNGDETCKCKITPTEKKYHCFGCNCFKNHEFSCTGLTNVGLLGVIELGLSCLLLCNACIEINERDFIIKSWMS